MDIVSKEKRSNMMSGIKSKNTKPEMIVRKLSYIILRIYNVYSQNLKARGVIPDLINKMRNNKKIILKYPENVRDLIFIDDLTAMINKIIKVKDSGIFQVGTGKGIKIIQIAKAIKTQFNFDCRIINSKKRQSSSNFYSQADLKKNKKLLKWYPKINLKKGLRKIYEFNKIYE